MNVQYQAWRCREREWGPDVKGFQVRVEGVRKGFLALPLPRPFERRQ
jgi:hypothetical protein